MMSGTHIAVGMVPTLAIAQTGSIESCVYALIGGAVGSVISDTDIKTSRHYRDARMGRVAAVAVVIAGSCADIFYGAGVWNAAFDHFDASLLVGLVMFLAVGFFGAHSRHRAFTHLVLALVFLVSGIASSLQRAYSILCGGVRVPSCTRSHECQANSVVLSLVEGLLHRAMTCGWCDKCSVVPDGSGRVGVAVVI